jgi:hypothetical protein
MVGRLFRFARALSLDVALGGACSAALAAAVTGSALPVPAIVSLAAAIWTVYTVDHLLDARRLGAGASAPRHALHRAHSRALAALAGAAAALGGALALATLPARMLGTGLAIGILSLLHLANAQRSRSFLVPKEISAAAVYTLGVWCAPLAAATRVSLWALAAMGLFFLAATSNLLLNALLESETDARDGSPSAALEWGAVPTARAIRILGAATCLAAAIAACAARMKFHGVFPVLAVLGSVPMILLALRSKVAANERYRAFGDLAFLLGLVPVVLR